MRLTFSCRPVVGFVVGALLLAVDGALVVEFVDGVDDEWELDELVGELWFELLVPVVCDDVPWLSTLPVASGVAFALSADVLADALDDDGVPSVISDESGIGVALTVSAAETSCPSSPLLASEVTATEPAVTATMMPPTISHGRGLVGSFR